MNSGTKDGETTGRKEMGERGMKVNTRKEETAKKVNRDWGLEDRNDPDNETTKQKKAGNGD